jgi:adenosine kinase
MNILVTGSISFDEIMDFPGKFVDYLHPEKLHQINVSFAVSRLEKELGGTATNISYNASLIFNRVIILGAIGKDGREFVDFFRKNKIDASRTVFDKKLYTATGKVITDKKDNQIWGFYYGASEKANEISIKKYYKKDLLMVVSANHPKAFLHFQSEAIKYKVPYLYDPGMSLTWIKDKDLKEGILHCQYLIGNDYEIAMILKRLNYSIKKLTNYGLRIITTLGENGVRYEDKDQNIFIKAVKLKNVTDPTGAGDAWRGGFIAGLAIGLNLKECLKLGNVIASFAVEKYGTVNHKPTKEQIEKRLKTL